MSKYIYKFEDDENDMDITMEIFYEVSKGYWDSAPGGYGYLQYWITGDIYINDVKVLSVDSYDLDGHLMDHIERTKDNLHTFEKLDQEMEEHVEHLIEEGDDLCEALWENR